MSQFTQQQETEIVCDAMKLTYAIQTENEELSRLKAERFRSRPEPPQRRIIAAPDKVTPQYPAKPRSSLSFSTALKENSKKWKKWFIIGGAVAVLLIVLSIIISVAARNKSPYGAASSFSLVPLAISLINGIIIVFFITSLVRFFRMRSEQNQQLEDSPEYQKQLRAAEAAATEKQKELDNKHREAQAAADREYEAVKKKYETEIVPAYEKAAREWQTLQSRKIEAISNDLSVNSGLLNELYDQTRIISSKYRDLRLLEWLYEDMSTSDHDIRYATELLDRERQLVATQEAGASVRSSIDQMHSNMMQGMSAVYAAIEEGNNIQAETSALLNKTRRQMNYGTILTGIQNRKTNNLLGEISDSIKKK